MSIIIDTPARISRIKRGLIAQGISYGSKNVEYPTSYYILDEDGEKVLDEEGEPILQEGVLSPYVLDETGEVVTDENDEPVLAENYLSLIVQGVATQLSTITNALWVSIQAKPTNLGKIYISSDMVIRGRGNYVTPTNGAVLFPTLQDLSDVWIIGNAGEGVIFNFGTDETYVTLSGEDDESILGEDGEHVLGE